MKILNMKITFSLFIVNSIEIIITIIILKKIMTLRLRNNHVLQVNSMKKYESTKSNTMSYFIIIITYTVFLL